MTKPAGDVRPARHSYPPWLADDLAGVEKLLVSAAGESTHPLVAEAATHLIGAGGKRVRPALVLAAGRAGEPGESTALAAAAVELIHLASLYHDDVIDETETRRGVPTAHARWGVNVAILAGDLLFASGCALGAEAGGEVPSILAYALRDLCDGQIREVAAAGDVNRSIDDLYETIGLKTAALFRASCELGAVTAGAEPSHRRALVAYGQALGMAFQLVDDLLDYVGNPEITGKEPGTDWREGIFTLPILLGRDRSEDVRRACAERRGFDDVLAALHATGALSDARTAAETEVDRALEALADMPAGIGRDVLEGIAQATIAQVRELGTGAGLR